ncbi:ATP-binding SpoIIE family protein phosphatase [Amycolatopsis alkalitolerans]|uniref:GAF domain-containing protein n=1 Tax=Amycolatopsis alkalitolerans TaxID=2547244 RepID=A0A5C4M892_9PSEU|nr:SpoIIE family protein phosphatase [Amycolatopsis alkalitolerans]TNC29687.1 GAF domain-containing protein [Amycolatopsis alkalitolerans]
MARTASAEGWRRPVSTVTDTHADSALLHRVCQELRVDTVVVLLLAPGGRELVASAAVGIELEVRHGVRIPVGQGFAGRVAAERRPVTLDRVDGTTVFNKLLWEKGIQSLLGVPILAGGEVVGVLHVGSLTPREFTQEDVEALQAAAQSYALSIRLQQAQAATALQRSLLPANLPEIPSLDFAARYVPGGHSNFAGDWYDVFSLPNGCLGIVIGDVVGHDLPAAVVMGRVRSALRAYALETTDPADVLTRLDRKLQHFEPGMMATVLYGTLDPGFDRLHLSSAGHLAPVLARRGAPAEFAQLTVDPPIGTVREPRRHTTSVALPPGTVACFYTDGLVERRHAPIEAGLELLRSTVAEGPAEEVCTGVMSALIGDHVPGDDVALLAVRREAEIGAMEIAVSAVPESLKDIRSAMRRWLSSTGIGGDVGGDLLLAAGEACTNSVEHAYGPAGGDVRVRLERLRGEVVITVRDSGRWRPARGKNRGRGLTLMGKCGDVHVERGTEGTTVVIRRRLWPEGPE